MKSEYGKKHRGREIKMPQRYIYNSDLIMDGLIIGAI